MDFDIDLVRTDITYAQRFLSFDPAYFNSLRTLGNGSAATVKEFGHAAIRSLYPHMHGTIHEQLRQQSLPRLVELGKRGMAEGVHFAPTLDYIPRFEFMPKVAGTLPTDRNALIALCNLPDDGLKKYFRDWLTLESLGFMIDDGSQNNLVIGDKNINFVDLEVWVNPDHVPDIDKNAELCRARENLLYTVTEQLANDDFKLGSILVAPRVKKLDELEQRVGEAITSIMAGGY